MRSDAARSSLPTRRLARELAYAVDCDRRRTSDTWPTPDAVAIDAFLERCYRQFQDAAVPGADALLLPERILPFVLARAVPNPAWLRHIDTFADAWRIANLHGVPSVDPRLSDTENGRAYKRWAQALEALLEAEGWIASAQLPDRLVRLIDGPSGWRPPVATALGFDEPAAAIRRFFTAARIPTLAMNPGTAATSLKLVATASQRQDDARSDAGGEELALAALWARERLAEDPGARVGVVVAGLGPAFAAIQRRFHAAWPEVASPEAYVNVSGGLALAQEPICRDALEILAFTADGLDRSAPDRARNVAVPPPVAAEPLAAPGSPSKTLPICRTWAGCRGRLPPQREHGPGQRSCAESSRPSVGPPRDSTAARPGRRRSSTIASVISTSVSKSGRFQPGPRPWTR